MKRRGMLHAAAAVLLALTLSGCATLPEGWKPAGDASSAPSASAPAPAPVTLTLSYSGEDTFNPYAAKTAVNLYFAGLLYEGLTSFDANLVPQPALAASITAADPLKPVAALRTDARFSDGSVVTAADVAESFRLAKASANYAALLANVQSAQANKDGTVTFTLAARDRNYQACLSFPVLKTGTASAVAPIGTGPYVFRDGETPSLAANSHARTAPATSSIALKSLSDEAAILHGLESGMVSFYFSDLTDGEIPRTSSATMDVPLNYLVFLGFNAKKAGLSEPEVRQALSAAVSRKGLVEAAFAGRATPALTPFPSFWGPAVEIKGFAESENIASAVAQLQKAGYNTTGGTVPSGTDKVKTLSLELLVSKGNSFRQAAAQTVKSQLAKAGVEVTVTELAFSEYESRLRKGQFDLYIGEVRLTAAMSLRPFFSGGDASWGVAANSAAAAAYAQYQAGSVTMQEFVDAFVKDAPFAPLCWRKGIAAYNRAVSGVSPHALNLYYRVEKWAVAGK